MNTQGHTRLDSLKYLGICSSTHGYFTPIENSSFHALWESSLGVRFNQRTQLWELSGSKVVSGVQRSADQDDGFTVVYLEEEKRATPEDLLSVVTFLGDDESALLRIETKDIPALFDDFARNAGGTVLQGRQWQKGVHIDQARGIIAECT